MNMKEIIITNKGLSEKEFEAALARVRAYTPHCYLCDDKSHITVHFNPERVYSIDAGRIVEGATAAKLAIDHYLKDYLHGVEIETIERKEVRSLDDTIKEAKQQSEVTNISTKEEKAFDSKEIR